MTESAVGRKLEPPVVASDLPDVFALVAAFGRLLPTPARLDRRAEELDLAAGVARLRLREGRRTSSLTNRENENFLHLPGFASAITR